MGTRGFVGFVADAKETITYNQFDSYPDHLGVNVLNWARSVGDWQATKGQAAALVHVSDDVPPTPEQIEALRGYANTSVSTKELTEWYVLLRETHGSPADILVAGHAVHAPEWPGDSLFCEWGYLVDMDAGVLEVYQGFQTRPHKSGRFHDRPRPTHSEYYPVRRVASWPLSELPSDTQFVTVLEDAEASAA